MGISAAAPLRAYCLKRQLILTSILWRRGNMRLVARLLLPFFFFFKRAAAAKKAGHNSPQSPFAMASRQNKLLLVEREAATVSPPHSLVNTV